ncbi:DNA adenine methylase [Fusobacterium polymorphum]|uniref:DNA adenine methylase n=1 Tax=Fusobacterium nucleatum subsp. polymorphum TaxID=76857 RepID=UPI000BFC4D0E|nr:DNA adenine methylase [Fusobacterium polymorphum]PHI09211.1 DNA methyltransferase [Fusobacterium polymorphum]
MKNLKLFLDVEDKKSKLVSSPFNYTGGKYKLLEQLQKLFKEEEIFLDIFAGGANVGINSKSPKIIFNDVNAKIISLIEYIKNIDIEELLKKIDDIIVKYGLSNTMLYGYEYYSCNSSEGLANYNKEAFLKLRKDYNKKLNDGMEDYTLLYVLIVFSFNNQVRFNSKGEFNLPVGKRDFNSKMRNKLILFSKKLKEKDIEFYSKDFREIDINKISKNTFIYCDPPYLITTAGYNENGMWTDKEEKDLLNFLKELNKKGLKFALSNVLESKNKENKILKDWILENNFYCNYLKKDYSNSNYQRKAKNSISVEVLVTNYNTDEM